MFSYETPQICRRQLRAQKKKLIELFKFWEAASIVSLGETKNGFIFEIKFWLRVWSQSLSFLEFVASNSRLACLGSHRMRAERVVAALLWFYKHDSGSYWGGPFLRACFFLRFEV